MSELSRIDEKIPSTDCGSIILSCDQPHLQAELAELAQGKWEPGDYELLAEPFFDSDIAKHVIDASFGIEYDANDELYATGYIEYEIARAYPRQHYRSADKILHLLWQHLELRIHFHDYSFKIKDNELSIELGDQAFRILVDIDRKYPGSCAMITVESDYGASIPATDDVYSTAVIWAQVCDFVIRLGTGKHTALTHNQVSRVTLGKIADHPSDIELMLVNEVEERRRALGVAATLPQFDENILSDVIQNIAYQDTLSIDEVRHIATYIVNKKREEYAVFDIMTTIDQSDIVEALATALKKRKTI